MSLTSLKNGILWRKNCIASVYIQEENIFVCSKQFKFQMLYKSILIVSHNIRLSSKLVCVIQLNT